jgi:hypothetical protein
MRALSLRATICTLSEQGKTVARVKAGRDIRRRR